MKYKLSIIIPVYKVEKYIKECLDSIFSQLSNKVEIIIINDGTPDRSMEIIKLEYADWLAKDQILLIEQKNKGVSAARNKGISIARGQYISFLDSDDILLDNYFYNILNIISEQKPDIIEYRFKRFKTASEINSCSLFPSHHFHGLYKMNKVRNKIFAIGRWFSCIRIFKTKLLKNNLFPEKIAYGEDIIPISKIYLQDLTIYFLNEALYGYRINNFSVTLNHNKSHANDMFMIYNIYKKMPSSIPVKITQIKIARTLTYLYTELNSVDYDIDQIIEDLRLIKKNIKIIINLQLPDLVFFIFPRIYIFIDKMRLKKQKEKI